MRQLKTKKRVYKKKPKRFAILRKAFFITRYFLSIPTVKPLLVIISLFSWLYYSGEYDAMAYKINDAKASLASSMGLTLQDILLEGQKHTAREDILDIIATHSETTDIITSGESIFNIDLWALKQQLENLTWVSHASAERLYPSTLGISIIERKPIALWQDSGKLYLMDEAGDVIKEKYLENYSDLIILVGSDVPTHAGYFLNTINSEKTLAPLVSSATRVSKRRWDVKLYNGIIVNLPEKNADEAWAYLASTNEESGILESDAKKIDLRIKDKMFVR